MTGTTLDLSIVIVAWNVGDLLAVCLRSLNAGLGDVQAEIIVVDNGSVDGTAQLVKEQFPGVRLIVSKENVGFSKGNNLGMRASQGRYLVLLNADTVVLPAAVEKLIHFMDRTPDAGIAGCKQVYPNGEWQSTCHRMITLKREAMVALGLSKLLPRWIDYGDLPLKATEPFRVDWVGGACLIIRRELAERVGLLDENIFIYAEDADLCQRVADLGYFVYYLPNVSIIHYRGQSASRSSELAPAADYSKLRLQFIGRRYVIKKHFGNVRGNIYYGFIIVEVIRKLLQNSLKVLLPQPPASRHAMKGALREYLAVLNASLKGEL